MNVEVSTVDGFQGREKEVIVLSLVRSNQDRELGFVTDFRRLNVAVTRARRSLVIIADSETMEKDELIVSLLKHIEEQGLLQTAEEYLSATIDKEIEKIEKVSEAGRKPKAKPKAKGKSSRKEAQTEKCEKKESSEVADKGKLSEEMNKKLTAKLSRKGMELNTCVNRKKYNVFESIATAQEGEDEEEGEKVVINLDLRDTYIWL